MASERAVILQHPSATVPALHDPRDPDVLPSPIDRLDDYRKEERGHVDLMAEQISQAVYGKSYDVLPGDVRRRVVRSALKAIREPQPVWRNEAVNRAVQTLDRAMFLEMGMPYAAMTPGRRKELAVIGVQTVLAALVGGLELSDPFTGPVEALRVYDAAAMDAKGVR